jgi:penicillin V acylase-like amidase (Ntn superfamily)
MSRHTSLLSLGIFILSSSAQQADACTSFLLENGKGQRVIGKSYDWDQGQGVVLWNPHGLVKQAIPSLEPGERPARWTSRFASLTFNQYGREMPTGGMNEKGLVVEILWLASSAYPIPDSRPTIRMLQWVQYQLDNYSTVAEVLTHLHDLRVTSPHAKVHCLICDRSAPCAAVEYLDGHEVVTTPANVLTNNSHAESAAYRARLNGHMPSGNASLARFARASALTRQRPKADLVKQSFEILENVAQDEYTKWNIVYDPVKGEVWYRSRGSWDIKAVTLAAFDPSCRAPAQMLDLAAPGGGNANVRFRTYQHDANEAFVSRSLAPIAQRLPPGVAEALANYPDSLACSTP